MFLRCTHQFAKTCIMQLHYYKLLLEYDEHVNGRRWSIFTTAVRYDSYIYIIIVTSTESCLHPNLVT